MKAFFASLVAMPLSCFPALAQGKMTLGGAVKVLNPELREQITKIHVALGGPKLCGLPVNRSSYMKIFVRQLRIQGESSDQIRAAELFGAHTTMRFNEIDKAAIAPSDLAVARNTGPPTPRA